MRNVKKDSTYSDGRLEWLDVLKFIGMYLVIIGHASEVFGIHSYRHYIYSFHMPLFFMISGMGFYLQLQKKNWTFTDMLVNKLKRLAWPYITLNLLALPIWYLNHRVLTSADDSFEYTLIAICFSNQKRLGWEANATWFIPTLFFALMLFYLIVTWSRKNRYWIAGISIALGIGGLALSLIRPRLQLPWHLSTVPVAVMFLMMGYFFIENIQTIHRLLEKWYVKIIALILCLAAGLVCARFNVDVSMHINRYGNWILFMGSVLFLSMACYLVATIIPPLGIFKFIGRNTLVLLAFHQPCFRLMENLSPATHQFILDYPILTGTLVMILLLPLCYVVERWLPFLLGKPRKTKKKAEDS